MAETKLEKIHQVFIVEHLAVFERPKSVQAKIKEVYGIEISLPGIQHYQLTSKELSKDLRKIFNATRKNFLNNSSSIPIANKSFRLQKLQNMFERQEDGKLQNPVEMRNILEQSAKEAGDAYSNTKKIEHSGDKDNPVHIKQSNSIDLSNVSKEELLLIEKILAKTNKENAA